MLFCPAGVAMGFLAWMDTAGNFLGQLLFNSVYSASLAVFRPAIYYLGLGLFCLTAGLTA